MLFSVCMSASSVTCEMYALYILFLLSVAKERKLLITK
jgi:hypothetical protein